MQGHFFPRDNCKADVLGPVQRESGIPEEVREACISIEINFNFEKGRISSADGGRKGP